jgi:hypothetical protein
VAAPAPALAGVTHSAPIEEVALLRDVVANLNALRDAIESAAGRATATAVTAQGSRRLREV